MISTPLASLLPPLSAGQIGVVLARAGVGKTSFLVQIGLRSLLAEGYVLHLALGQSLDQVQHYYDTLFAEQARGQEPEESEHQKLTMPERRAILALSNKQLKIPDLQKSLHTFLQHLKWKPSVVLVDGGEWEPDLAPWLALFRASAQTAGCGLWFASLLDKQLGTAIPQQIPAALKEVDQALVLRTGKDGVELLQLGSDPQAAKSLSVLSPATLLPMGSELAPAPGFTLHSGGAEGAEECFGTGAERYGLGERTYSFAGRQTARSRGLVLLSEEELKEGEVSSRYLTATMKRHYRQEEEFRKILQSIWHQVNPAGEVFAVGRIQANGTVKGGTGWAVELAKHLSKPVWVYDLEQNTWLRFQAQTWQAVPPPVISRSLFVGTGTRKLSDAGRKAIDDLFARSFGKKG